MHKPLLIREQTSLEQVAQLMMEKQQDHIFIDDKEEKLIGVVSGIDIVKKIIELIIFVRVNEQPLLPRHVLFEKTIETRLQIKARNSQNWPTLVTL